MLNITPSRNADAARDYFARSLSPGDYYAERGGIDAVWLGKGAERLGLRFERRMTGYGDLETTLRRWAQDG